MACMFLNIKRDVGLWGKLINDVLRTYDALVIHDNDFVAFAVNPLCGDALEAAA